MPSTYIVKRESDGTFLSHVTEEDFILISKSKYVFKSLNPLKIVEFTSENDALLAIKEYCRNSSGNHEYIHILKIIK